MNTDIAAQRALDRMAEVGLEGLTESERISAVVWTFAAGVANNGFEGYFSSHRGDLAFVAPNALRRIDATELAQIAEDANAVFGADGPPRDHWTRRAALLAMPPTVREVLAKLDRQYESCDEDVDELLERFLAKKQSL